MFKKIAFISICLAPYGLAHALIGDDIRIMRRGDANNDGTVNMSDAITISSYLFEGGPEPPCLNQADANDDGAVDISDCLSILLWLFQEGSAPSAPGPFNNQCTTDGYPRPGCAFDPCL